MQTAQLAMAAQDAYPWPDAQGATNGDTPTPGVFAKEFGIA